MVVCPGLPWALSCGGFGEGVGVVLEGGVDDLSLGLGAALILRVLGSTCLGGWRCWIGGL